MGLRQKSRHTNRNYVDRVDYSSDKTSPCTGKKTENLAGCACTYDGCSRRALLRVPALPPAVRSRELPGGRFPPAAERTYDRSFAHFARLVAAGKI